MSERRLRDVPPIAVSDTSTLANRTGSWKYVRPMYRDLVAPCNAGCPVGIDIEGYMNLLREDRLDEALDLLLRENPMPAVTGRVCHHPCETACNRAHIDEAVAIHAVERMLGDRLLAGCLPDTPRRTRRETVAVIGSGPAGLGCAYFLARMGYAVTVYEEAEQPGGMLRLGIPAYRLPRDVLDRQIAWIEAQGVAIRCGVRLGVDLTWDDLGADAVFLAPGAHRSRDAGLDGERHRGVRSGLGFLRAVNAGERPPLGDRVVVIGGGNTAMDCARTALRLGAQPLVLYRRGRAEMPAIPEEIADAEREGVRFVFLAAPTAVETASGRLVGLACRRMTLGPPDESGRRRPVPSDEAPFSVLADTVLTAIGEVADLDALDPAAEAVGGGIRTGRFGATTRAAVFAGGDAADGTRTVADALGSGKRGALGIDEFLRSRAGEELWLDDTVLRLGARGNVSVTRWRDDDPVRRTAPVNELVGFEAMNPAHFLRQPRHHDQRVDPSLARSAFGEANQGLAAREALGEARRCCNCGVCNECELCLIFCPDLAIRRRPEGGFEIDLEYCKGCGVCAEECPRGAIVMTREGL